jgi:exosome complex RNA-binding protein Rrp42 (RNase PH superfamily)
MEIEKTISADTFKQLLPEQFIRKHLQQKIRPDGRGIDAAREVHFNVGYSSLTQDPYQKVKDPLLLK